MVAPAGAQRSSDREIACAAPKASYPLPPWLLRITRSDASHAIALLVQRHESQKQASSPAPATPIGSVLVCLLPIQRKAHWLAHRRRSVHWCLSSELSPPVESNQLCPDSVTFVTRRDCQLLHQTLSAKHFLHWTHLLRPNQLRCLPQPELVPGDIESKLPQTRTHLPSYCPAAHKPGFRQKTYPREGGQ